jgi:hypothetical protein
MLKDILREHCPLLAVTAFNLLFLTFVQLSLDLKGENVFAVGLDPLPAFFFFFAIAPLIFSLCFYIRAIDKGEPFLSIPDKIMHLLTLKNLLRYAFSFVVIYFALLSFSPVKSLITFIHPHEYDPLFAQIDHFLHFGKYPHEYLSFIINSPPVVQWFDIFYTTWFFYIYAYLVWVMFQPAYTKGRMQLIAAFCLTWTVLGNFLAIAAASVGPVFWEFYYDIPSPYIPLLTALENANAIVPLIQIDIADWLLGLQYDDKMVNVNGPSAMPSLHVGIAALIMLHSWSYNKVLFAFTGLYCLMTLVGSVVLAWHYAIDGYVAIILVYFVWKFAGWVESHFSCPQQTRS